MSSLPVRFLPLDPPEGGFVLSAVESVAVAGIQQRVAGAADLASMVELIAGAMQTVAPCDRYGLALIDPDSGRLVSRVVRAGYPDLHLKVGYQEPLTGSTLQTVIEERRIRLIEDLPAYLAAKPESVASRLLVAEGVRSSMTCPLLVDGRAVGVLFRSSRQSGAYHEGHVAVQVAIAERLAQAVEKAWRIEALESANRAYTEMLAFVSHELKAPVAGLVMEAEVLTNGYLGPVTEAQQQQLQKMIGKGRRLLGMVGDYLNLARLEGGLTPHRQTVDVRDAILVPALEMTAPALMEQESVLEDQAPASGKLTLTCDPDLVRIVITNLLANAVKYGQRHGRIRLESSTTPERWRFAVWNEGPGFGPEAQKLLFRRFSRLPDPELKKRPGTGVGLYLSDRIARLHGGRLEAESEPGRWARFSLVMPRS